MADLGESIGNLSIKILGDASQAISEWNRMQTGLEDAIKGIDTSTSTMAKSMEGMGLKVIAGAHAFTLLHREILYTIENIDKIPGIPPEMVTNINQARDAFAQFRNSVDFAIASVINFGAQWGKMIGATVAMMGGADGEDVQNALSGINDPHRQAGNEDAKARMGIVKFDSELEAARQKLIRLKEKEVILNGTLSEQYAEHIRLWKGNLELAARAPDDVADLQHQVTAQEELNKARAVYNKLETEYYQSVQRKNEARKSIQDVLGNDTKQERLSDIWARIQANDVGHSIDVFGTHDYKAQAEWFERMAKTNKELTNDMARAIPLLKQQAQEWENLGKKMSDSLIKGIETGDLKGAWHNLMRQLEDDMLHTLFGEELKAFFTKMLKGLFANSTNNVGGSTGIFGNILGALFHFAGGGNVSGPSIVGENGPELFVPAGGGLITDNFTTRGLNAGGKGGDTYIIDARSADRAGLARLEAYIKAVDGSVEMRAVNASLAYQRRTPASANY